VVLSSGTTDSSISHPRDVFRAAVLASATRLAVFHNHPTGDPLPSAADVLFTRHLMEAGDLMGIEVLDHVILGDTRYYSFKEARKR
jgi:DNA repair protein RadC